MGHDGAIVFRSEAIFESPGLVVAMAIVEDEYDDQDDGEDSGANHDLKIGEGQVHGDSPVRETPRRLRADDAGFSGGGPMQLIMGAQQEGV